MINDLDIARRKFEQELESDITITLTSYPATTKIKARPWGHNFEIIIIFQDFLGFSVIEAAIKEFWKIVGKSTSIK